MVPSNTKISVPLPVKVTAPAAVLGSVCDSLVRTVVNPSVPSSPSNSLKMVIVSKSVIELSLMFVLVQRKSMALFVPQKLALGSTENVAVVLFKLTKLSLPESYSQKKSLNPDCRLAVNKIEVGEGVPVGSVYLKKNESVVISTGVIFKSPNKSSLTI